MKYPSFTTLTMVLCIISSCSRDTTQPGYEIPVMTDMKRSTTYEAFSKSMVFKRDGSLRSPVTGTVHRNALVATGNENPVTLSAEAMNRGEYLYNNYCIICHGKSGDGDGPLIPRYTNPPMFTSERLMKMTPHEMYDIVTNGKKNMPSHAGQIDQIDRWKIIHYVQKLQGKVK